MSICCLQAFLPERLSVKMKTAPGGRLFLSGERVSKRIVKAVSKRSVKVQALVPHELELTLE